MEHSNPEAGRSPSPADIASELEPILAGAPFSLTLASPAAGRHWDLGAEIKPGRGIDLIVVYDPEGRAIYHDPDAYYATSAEEVGAIARFAAANPGAFAKDRAASEDMADLIFGPLD